MNHEHIVVQMESSSNLGKDDVGILVLINNYKDSREGKVPCEPGIFVDFVDTLPDCIINKEEIANAIVSKAPARDMVHLLRVLPEFIKNNSNIAIEIAKKCEDGKGNEIAKELPTEVKHDLNLKKILLQKTEESFVWQLGKYLPKEAKRDKNFIVKMIDRSRPEWVPTLARMLPDDIKRDEVIIDMMIDKVTLEDEFGHMPINEHRTNLLEALPEDVREKDFVKEALHVEERPKLTRFGLHVSRDAYQEPVA